MSTVFNHQYLIYCNNQKYYKIEKHIMKSLKSVNDSAKREVKFIKEYNNKFRKYKEQTHVIYQCYM
jgi:hypothetical protein